MGNKVEDIIKNISLKTYRKSFKDLSTRYQEEDFSLLSTSEKQVYLTTRLPAIYEVLYFIFKEINLHISEREIKSILDCGSGPGTSYFAIKEFFLNLERLHFLERDPQWISIGKEIIEEKFLSKCSWSQADLTKVERFIEHDLVLFSYSLGEIPIKYQSLLIEKIWSSTKKLLVIVEPGTPKGFSCIRRIREQLLSLGGYLIAPCPHANACPIQDPDWCHFSKRVSRSSFHRLVKEGSLGYEDEKFSYLVVSKNNLTKKACARVLRHPIHRPGHSILKVCSQEGLQTFTVSKREKEKYKKAGKVKWGETWE